jgi:DNA-binding MarR family transcriptional regulator
MEKSDDPDTGALAMAVTTTLERLVGVLRRLSPAGELSSTAASALATLERSGPCRLTFLAAQAGVTQPAMTQLITRLEEAGLAGRAPDPADGRVVLVGITADGRAVVARRRAIRAQRLARMLAELQPEDRAALGAALPALDALASADPDDQTLAAARPLS